MPTKAHENDAGYDLKAAVDMLIPPFGTAAVSTGFRMQLPKGYEAQIRPRSGCSMRGLQVANSPGTIDCNYTGEIKVIVFNATPNEMQITKGSRIAQMVIQKLPEVELICGKVETNKERGDKGFGSTGT